LGLWGFGSAEAQLQQVATLMNVFGGRSTGGTYTQIGAGAQPGGIGTSYDPDPSVNARFYAIEVINP